MSESLQTIENYDLNGNRIGESALAPAPAGTILANPGTGLAVPTPTPIGGGLAFVNGVLTGAGGGSSDGVWWYS
jgi:hypothetical protein